MRNSIEGITVSDGLKLMNIFLSNSLDLHYEQLKQRLFGKTSPFRRRIVVVYGPAMQSWLMLKMAQDPEVGIAAGIEFIYLNQAFEHLLKIAHPSLPNHFPTLLELSLGIEKELNELIGKYHTLNREEKEEWSFLINYLKVDPGKPKLTKKMEKRIVGLSSHMATIFRDYSHYGNFLVEQWKEKSSVWQRDLWNGLYNQKTGWTAEAAALAKDLNVFDENCEVHFFSISFISKSEFDFLHRLSKQAATYYYLLSPCAVFWSDVRSDKENSRLYSVLKDKETFVALEEYLRDRNPLLANFGRLGREMATQIELSNAQTAAKYILPSTVQQMDENIEFHDDLLFYESKGPLTLLQAVQADMLLLRNPAVEPKCVLDDAESIQLHQAPTRRREIQILYNNLLRIIEKHPDIHPGDIIVMAPKIADYVPYIRAQFESSQLNCQILDLGMQNHNEVVQGFTQLLRLVDSRWDANDILQLFENRAFQRRNKFSSADYFAIQNWIKKASIHWGDNEEHRDELLSRRHCQNGMTDATPVGSWDFGLARLMLGLTTIQAESKERAADIHPCEHIDFSQADLLDKWIGVIHSLRDDLSPLYDGTRMTMKDWAKYLLCLLESYFQPDFEDADSVQDFEGLKIRFDHLNRSTIFKETLYPYISVKIHLDELLQQKGMTYRENYLQSVRFCSLMPLRSIPAKVIAILGMEEGAFPRQNQFSSLNLMPGSKECDYCPQPADYDRYLFLEAIHSAQRYLLFSYQGYCSKDQKELHPCLVVTELFSYLNNHYEVQGKSINEACLFKHPFDSFDPAYFQKGSPIHNFIICDYLAAQINCNGEKTASHAFLHEFNLTGPSQKAASEPCRILEIKNLMAVAKDPIKFHLQRVLEIYLKNSEEREVKIEEELTISHLTKYQMSQDFFTEPVEFILDLAENEGKMPQGIFKTIAANKFRNDYEELEDRLKKYQLQKEDIFKIEFSLNCKKAGQVDRDHWIVPAVEVECGGIKNKIIGMVSSVSKHGIVTLKKGDVEECWKQWPQLLMLYCAQPLIPFNINPQIIPLDAAKPKQFPINDHLPFLKLFINYFDLCHLHISPLMPEWINNIALQDAKGLKKKMESTFESYKKESKWILSKKRFPDPEQIISDWHPHLKSLAGCLFELRTKEEC